MWYVCLQRLYGNCQKSPPRPPNGKPLHLGPGIHYLQPHLTQSHFTDYQSDWRRTPKLRKRHHFQVWSGWMMGTLGPWGRWCCGCVVLQHGNMLCTHYVVDQPFSPTWLECDVTVWQAHVPDIALQVPDLAVNFIHLVRWVREHWRRPPG